jgi:hypothetical protein
MAILVGVMAPQLIKYIEKSKVSSDTQAADSIHTAVLTAMMDPEVVNRSEYNANFAAYQTATSATELKTSGQANVIASAAGEILGGSFVTTQLKSTNASDISFQIVSGNKVSVWVVNSDSRGSKSTGTTYNIVVQ